MPRWRNLAAVTAFCACVALNAQEKGEDAFRLRQELRDRTSALRRDLEGGARSGVLPSVRRRAVLFEKLLRLDPSAALEEALAPEEADSIVAGAPEVSTSIERHGHWSGVLQTRVEDDLERGQARHFTRLQTPEGGLDLSSAGALPQTGCGQQVEVEGVRAGTHLAAREVHVLADATAAASGCSTLGTQNVAVLLVNMPSHTLPSNVTPSLVQSAIFGPGTTLNTYWNEVSYGAVSVTGAVFGPFKLDADYACSDLDNIRNAAFRAADATVNLGSYSRIFIIMPPNGTCAIGVGDVGCGPLYSARAGAFTAAVAWMRADYLTSSAAIVSLAAHEGGHNLGLYHSGTADYGTVTLGAPSDPGTFSQYGDLFSAMGASWSVNGTFGIGHYAAEQKQKLGWLGSGKLRTVTGPGTFTVQPYESSASAVQALRIQRGDTGQWLWLEYRQPQGGYDPNLNLWSTTAFSGAIVRQEDPAGSGFTRLLDFNPGALPNDFSRSPFLPGSSWKDPYSSLSLKVESASGAGLTVTAAYGAAACGASALGSASGTFAASGGSGSFTLTASGSTCSWTAASNVGWISVTSAGSGQGNATITYTVTPNSGSSRTGTITAGGQTYTVVQGGSTGSLSLSRTALMFGATAGGIVTGPQHIYVSISGASGVAWTAFTSAANITVSPASGNGSGGFDVQITPGASGTVTVSAGSPVNAVQQISIQINTAPASSIPYGAFETPADGAAGITGAVGVTGWALDALEVTKIEIWRDPLRGETPQSRGLIYIGDASFVSGARPDVTAAYPGTPLNDRAGWGYLLLTNLLPNTDGTTGLGNGTYRLHAIAHSRTGGEAELGAKTISCTNRTATVPFGTIDTPAQGATVSGSIVNFGWALTPRPASIPTNGATITVYIDNQAVGHPVYNQARGDVSAAFPGLANSGAPGASFSLDTTRLSNGVHTIAWGVSDSLGNAAGLGSRYFTVQN